MIVGVLMCLNTVHFPFSFLMLTFTSYLQNFIRMRSLVVELHVTV